MHRADRWVDEADIRTLSRAHDEARGADVVLEPLRGALKHLHLKQGLPDDCDGPLGDDDRCGLGLCHCENQCPDLRPKGGTMARTAMTFLMLAPLVLAQVGPAANPFLERGIGQVERLDEDNAVKTLEQARAWPRNTPEQLAQVQLWLGLAYAGLNQSSRAKESFRAALVLNPHLSLPPGRSPRIQSWWQESGGTISPTEMAQEAPPPRPAPAPAVVTAPPPAPAPELPRPSLSWKRWTGGSLAGAGLVTIAVGVAFGLQMVSLSNQAKREP